ncbi:hypothetical protein I3760_05G031200 [Carya illinoinensis]|nr:hypothetical protein I3760_05G031200 [Carya illinoinensis]
MSKISETSPWLDLNMWSMPKNQSSPYQTPFVQITNIHLNEVNFLRWSQSVRMYICRRGKIGYLTGETKAPGKADTSYAIRDDENSMIMTWLVNAMAEEDGETMAPDKADTSYAIWDDENSMIMTWLVNAMVEDISANYICYPTAKALWDNVSQMYSNLGNYSHIYELEKKKNGKTQQGEDNVTKYFNVLKGLWQDLDLFNDYEWKSLDDCNYNKKVENSRIFKFLLGLNDEFDEVRGRILGRQPLPPIEEVFFEVRREDCRRNVMLKKRG